jgi:hypothetical protein
MHSFWQPGMHNFWEQECTAVEQINCLDLRFQKSVSGFLCGSFSGQVYQLAMEQDTVKQSGGQDFVIEEFSPSCRRLVGGNDDGRAFVDLVWLPGFFLPERA